MGTLVRESRDTERRKGTVQISTNDRHGEREAEKQMKTILKSRSHVTLEEDLSAFSKGGTSERPVTEI